MTRSKKLLSLIVAAGAALTASAATAGPLVTASGRPACGNVMSKSNSYRGERGVRQDRREALRLRLLAATREGKPAEELEKLTRAVLAEDYCIAELDRRSAPPAPQADPAPRRPVARR
jgi:hypothetical protein